MDSLGYFRRSASNLQRALMCALAALVGLSLLNSAADRAQAEDPPAAPTAKIDFLRDIKPIFDAKCSECHGEKQAKGDFRVDDRAALLSTVAGGDLESSSLWTDYLITDDASMRMPPPAQNSAVTAVELAAIRVWILDGAEWPETAAPAVSDQEASKSTLHKAFLFTGYFHPAVVHFPIALLVVSFLFSLLSFVNRSVFEPAAFHLLWMGAAGAIAACVMGWAFADVRGYPDFWHSSFTEHQVARHRNTGVALSVAALIVTGLAYAARVKDKKNLRVGWLLGSALLALMVSVVGHQGGELSYGEDLYGKAYRKVFGLENKPVETTPVAETK
ncbi:MAG: DUF2231 domain-containing protein [Pirellulales bacterium]